MSGREGTPRTVEVACFDSINGADDLLVRRWREVGIKLAQAAAGRQCGLVDESGTQCPLTTFNDSLTQGATDLVAVDADGTIPQSCAAYAVPEGQKEYSNGTPAVVAAEALEVKPRQEYL